MFSRASMKTIGHAGALESLDVVLRRRQRHDQHAIGALAERQGLEVLVALLDRLDVVDEQVELAVGEGRVDAAEPLSGYLWSFRNDGIFYERAVNRILDDLVAAAAPRWMEVVGDFNVRGGIKTIITARAGLRRVAGA